TSSNTSNFLSSASAPITEQVNAAPTTTTLAGPTGPVGAGQPATFTATVSAAPSTATPTGIVTFQVNGTTVATANLNANGQASFTTSALVPGSNTVSAAYTPDSANFLASSTSTTIAA